MSPVTVGLWLAAFSALTTALAHALIKSGTDKLAVQAWVRLFGLTIATPVAVWIDGVEQPMESRQSELRERYRNPVEGALPNAYDR